MKKIKPVPNFLKLFAAEFIGTALLLSIGLSFVIFDWGDYSIVVCLVPSVSARRLLTDFLFGCTGCLTCITVIILKLHGPVTTSSFPANLKTRYFI